MTPEENMKELVTGIVERQAQIDRLKLSIEDKVNEIAMRYAIALMKVYPNYNYPLSNADFIDWHIEDANIEIDWSSEFAYDDQNDATLAFAAAYLYDENWIIGFERRCEEIKRDHMHQDKVKEHLNDERELARLKEKLGES